ncbi:MAG: hypothetical protein M3M85_02175 [bacterium]|nr:hypothetical protein [bacterium]
MPKIRELLIPTLVACTIALLVVGAISHFSPRTTMVGPAGDPVLETTQANPPSQETMPPPPLVEWEKSGTVYKAQGPPCTVTINEKELVASTVKDEVTYRVTIPQSAGVGISRNWDMEQESDYVSIQCHDAFLSLPSDVRRNFRGYYVAFPEVSIHTPFPDGRGQPEPEEP